MAKNIYLELTANGVAVEGEPGSPPVSRENDIECLSLQWGVALSLAAGSTTATGRRKYAPIVIRKRIDKATPAIVQALVGNESITGVFRFFRPDAGGVDEHFFTIEIHEARVSSVKHVSPETFNPATSDLPEIDEVSFVFERIVWSYVTLGIEFEDRLGAGS
jgi:type VI secretion system secreted protein Hcp